MPASTPPSATIIAPVTYDASSGREEERDVRDLLGRADALHGNLALEGMARPPGNASTNSASGGVSIDPGQTAFTRDAARGGLDRGGAG